MLFICKPNKITNTLVHPKHIDECFPLIFHMRMLGQEDAWR